MKTKIFLAATAALLFLSAYSGQARAETSLFSEPPSNGEYTQVLSLSAGAFSPDPFSVSNGSYNYQYGTDSTHSYLVEAGWSARLFWAAGAFYLSENLAYSQFSGTADAPSVAGDSLTLNLIGLDSRLVYAAEWFPLHWLIPYAEGGYQYSFYSQTGMSDLDSVQGGVGNAVAGAGARIWVNKSASQNSIPFFLNLKWNRIFGSGSSINLADNMFMAGIGVGL